MKEKFMRFMQGRYGVLDTLGKVLLVLGLVLAFFAPVFSGDHVIGMVFYLLGWGCLIYAYFRMFSRNVRKRYDENERIIIFIPVRDASRKSGFREAKAR